MKKKTTVIVVPLIILILTLVVYRKDISNAAIEMSSKNKEIRYAKYIAHAGGVANDIYYTNSREAIDNSYKNGHSLIELDMEWSTDGNLVLLHDWFSFSKLINSPLRRKYSDEEFKSFKIDDSLTTMNIDDLAEWLKKNKGVNIVTDVKVDNVKALKLISNRYPRLRNRFVAQIYSFKEYEKVKNLGYSNIILTLYASNYTDEEVVEFTRNHDLFAVTMPESTAKTQLPYLLEKENVFTYTHTINTQEEVTELEAHGIKGFYTDVLNP